jgi:hypothetical protein
MVLKALRALRARKIKREVMDMNYFNLCGVGHAQAWDRSNERNFLW